MSEIYVYHADIYLFKNKKVNLIKTITRAATTERTKKIITQAAACFVSRQIKEVGQFYGINVYCHSIKDNFLISIDAPNLKANCYDCTQQSDPCYLMRLIQLKKIGQNVDFWDNKHFKINNNQIIFNKKRRAVYSLMPPKSKPTMAGKKKLAALAKSKGVKPKNLLFRYELTEKEDHSRLDAH